MFLLVELLHKEYSGKVTTEFKRQYLKKENTVDVACFGTKERHFLGLGNTYKGSTTQFSQRKQQLLFNQLFYL